MDNNNRLWKGLLFRRANVSTLIKIDELGSFLKSDEFQKLLQVVKLPNQMTSPGTLISSSCNKPLKLATFE